MAIKLKKESALCLWKKSKGTHQPVHPLSRVSSILRTALIILYTLTCYMHTFHRLLASFCSSNLSLVLRKPVFGVSDQNRHKPGCAVTIRIAKTKALISFAVTAKLICVFVFAYAKSRFSHNEAHLYEQAGLCVSIDTEPINYDHHLRFGGWLNFEFS